MVTVDVLLGRRSDVAPPDVIVCIVDASNLQRNLYLVSQALELGRPLVVVLNKMDILEERGIEVDVPALSTRLGVPVIEMQAHRRIGLDALKQAIDCCSPDVQRLEFCSPLPRLALPGSCPAEGGLGSNGWDEPVPRYLAERLLLDTGGYLEHAGFRWRTTRNWWLKCVPLASVWLTRGSRSRPSRR